MNDYRQRLERIEKGARPARTFFAILTQREFDRVEKGQIPRPPGMIIVLSDSMFESEKSNRLAEHIESKQSVNGFGLERLTTDGLKTLIQQFKQRGSH